MDKKIDAITTLSGHSREEWHRHIDKLFDIAIPGEDIPFNCLLAWTQPVSPERLAEARKYAEKLETSLRIREEV